MRTNLSSSCNNNVGRLYGTNLLAKPSVKMFSSNTCFATSIIPGCPATETCRSYLFLVYSTNSFLELFRICHKTSSLISKIFSCNASSSPFHRSLPQACVHIASANSESQLGMCTPFVTEPVSYTHLRAHETPEHLVCRLLL